MEILTIVAIIGGVSLCLFAHKLAGKTAATSDHEQNQSLAPELLPSDATHLEEIR